MTEANIFFTDTVLPWYQFAGGLEGYIWCEQGGQVVAGSQFNEDGSGIPADVQPLKTGNTLNDINTFISDNIAAMSGVAPGPYSYPGAIGGGDWGTDAVPFPNTDKGRPFVALAFNDAFTFGTLNIPTRAVGGNRVWKFVILGFGESETVSPAKAEIDLYAEDNNTTPTLWVLELHQE